MHVLRFKLMIRVCHDMFGRYFAPHIPDDRIQWGGVDEDAFPKLDGPGRKRLMDGLSSPELRAYVEKHVVLSLNALGRPASSAAAALSDLKIDAPAAVSPAPRVSKRPHLAANVTVRIDVDSSDFVRELNRNLKASNHLGSGYRPRGACKRGPPRVGRSGVERKGARKCSDPWDFRYTMDARGIGHRLPARAAVEMREVVRSSKKAKVPYHNGLEVFEGGMTVHLSAHSSS